VDEILFSPTFIHSLRRGAVESFATPGASAADSCPIGDATHTARHILTPQQIGCMQRQECAVDNGHLA
jgi:hypothetical protein